MKVLKYDWKFSRTCQDFMGCTKLCQHILTTKFDGRDMMLEAESVLLVVLSGGVYLKSEAFFMKFKATNGKEIFALFEQLDGV